jgi:hypothetical protein
MTLRLVGNKIKLSLFANAITYLAKVTGILRLRLRMTSVFSAENLSNLTLSNYSTAPVERITLLRPRWRAWRRF